MSNQVIKQYLNGGRFRLTTNAATAVAATIMILINTEDGALYNRSCWLSGGTWDHQRFGWCGNANSWPSG